MMLKVNLRDIAQIGEKKYYVWNFIKKFGRENKKIFVRFFKILQTCYISDQNNAFGRFWERQLEKKAYA